ncbi:MAG TPA: EAL domain-containing response regulator [Hypericibacter adhaerens]|uniref:two-component system response regulator n=1 Tax=Hypericibacter adhaerens TaxID=2602016 RepID=UPI002D1B0741|nr:EAL domain-containing response regulator [Hypericibacter adhaerens]HWA41870.1 EAL domain-containing response regulator [Hypericibacter adhaerens]HWA79757.1 EAL domain-containing response regulator [Acetobacteraceae bacterium]
MVNRKILVMDDEPMVCEVICQVARSCGYEPFGTGDPGKFEAAIRKDPPHVVVLDLAMPRVDGVEILRKLSAHLANIPILIASGMDNRLLDAARQLGEARGLKMAGVIQKPFRVEELRAKLEKAVAGAGELSEEMIEKAVERDELDLHYQPYLDLESRRIVGAEALARWNHPERGIISSAAFIPLAEKSALIDRITQVVLNKAIAQLARWNQSNMPVDISINLSAKSIHDVDFPDTVFSICQQHAIDPAQITFELTETAAMQDPLTLLDVLTRLRLKGFRLAIDDFGTGYSSLAQLRRLPFSEMKVDLSFVSTMLTSRDSEIIVRTIIDMAHNLGLRTVAEGVENAATLDHLVKLSCDLAQGYHIARPMPADQFAPFLTGRPARQ